MKEEGASASLGQSQLPTRKGSNFERNGEHTSPLQPCGLHLLQSAPSGDRHALMSHKGTYLSGEDRLASTPTTRIPSSF